MLSFVEGDNYGSIYILLYTAIQFEEHHFLNMLSFFQCVFLPSLSKAPVHMYVDLCMCLWFNSIDKHACFESVPFCLYFYSSVANLENRDADTYSTSFIIQILKSYPSFLCFQKKLKMAKICEALCWDFDRTCFEFVEHFLTEEQYLLC